MSFSGKRKFFYIVLLIFRKRTSSQSPNLNGISEKDLYSDTGISVWLQGFPAFVLTYCLCNSFNDSYRILMLDQCLLQWPLFFLLAMSKDQGLSDWHWEKQMFIWSQNKWIYMTQQCVGKEKQEDWSRLEEEDIYTFLKAFVKTDYVFQNTSLKKTTSVFLIWGSCPFQWTRMPFQKSFIELSQHLWQQILKRGFPQQQWCLCIVHV